MNVYKQLQRHPSRLRAAADRHDEPPQRGARARGPSLDARCSPSPRPAIPSFRFRNGQFTMIGLEVDDRPLLRAYSLASANYEETLDFFSIKVPHGPLTSRLQHLKEGDPIIVSRKATGTLVLDNLLPAATSISRHRHRPCAVPQRDQGPGGLRALREGRAPARLPPGRRARLWRHDHRPLPDDELSARWCASSSSTSRP